MDFGAVGGICKLGERRKSFLQVLLAEFILTKEGAPFLVASETQTFGRTY